jgi:hypothetical protein
MEAVRYFVDNVMTPPILCASRQAASRWTQVSICAVPLMPLDAADSRTTLQCLIVTPVSMAVQKLVDRLVAEINLLEVSGVWTTAGVICCMHKLLDFVHVHCSLWLAVYSRRLPALVPGFVPYSVCAAAPQLVCLLVRLAHRTCSEYWDQVRPLVCTPGSMF